MIPLPINYVELEAVYAETVGAGARTVAITSSCPGEGVSTLAYALSRRSAAAGRGTLLVDLNLLHPSVAANLALPRLDWLPDMTSAETAVQRFPGVELSVLAAPLQAEGVLAFREKAVLGRQFGKWLDTYEVVIVDTSPLTVTNRRNIPADVVCATAEATVLVVLAGRVSEDILRTAADRLRQVRARVVGAVINDRLNPSLGDEIKREIRRLEPRWPGIAAKLQELVDRSTFLSARL